MTTYEKLVTSAVEFIRVNGPTQETIDNLIRRLPDAWASYIVADALDVLGY